MPDDSILGILRFLRPTYTIQLLLVSRRWGLRMRKRDNLWQVLCLEQAQWRNQLPKRPRRPWVDIYSTMLERDEAKRNLKSDEVLRKANTIIRKGDNLASLQKLVEIAENDFGFSINHQSSILLERNPLLNLAILHPLPKKAVRSKIIEWLVVEKNVHVNLVDKGGFTALMNAAWAGHRSTVVLLLNYGADVTQRGHSHFSGGIKTVERSAEEWARERKHLEVATLIQQWTKSPPEMIAKVKRNFREAKERELEAQREAKIDGSSSSSSSSAG